MSLLHDQKSMRQFSNVLGYICNVAAFLSTVDFPAHQMDLLGNEFNFNRGVLGPGAHNVDSDAGRIFGPACVFERAESILTDYALLPTKGPVRFGTSPGSMRFWRSGGSFAAKLGAVTWQTSKQYWACSAKSS